MNIVLRWVDSCDPLEEVNAEMRTDESGLKFRAEAVAGRGRNIDELGGEIAANCRFSRKVGDL